jgi:myosin heavy subunit
MIEAIRISRAAYPYRVTHAEFLARFAQLRPKIAKRMKELTLPSEQCMLLLNDIWPNQSYLGPKASKAGSGLSNKAFEVGKTKVYFSNGVLESLENIRGNLIHAHVIIIQSAFRASTVRRAYLRMRAACIRIQAVMRKIVYKYRLMRLKSAVHSLQRYVRMKLAKIRVSRLRSHFKHVRKNAIIITFWMKTKILRRKYLLKIAQIREDRELKKKIEQINAELEIERAARLDLENDMQSKLSIEKDLIEKQLHEKQQRELEAVRKSAELAWKTQAESRESQQQALREHVESEIDQRVELLVEQRVQEKLDVEIQRLTEHMQAEIEEENRCAEAQAAEKLNSQRAVMEAEFVAKQKDLADLQSRLQQQLATVQVTDQKKEHERQHLEKLEEEVIAFTFRENELSKQLKAVTAERDRLQQRLSTLESNFLEEMNNISNEVQAHKDAEQLLRQQLKELQEGGIAAGHDVGAAAREEALRAEVQTLSNIEQELRYQLEVVENESNNTRNLLRAADDKETILNGKLVEASKKEEALNTKVAELKRLLQEEQSKQERTGTNLVRSRQEDQLALSQLENDKAILSELVNRLNEAKLHLEKEQLSLTGTVSRLTDEQGHLQREKKLLANRNKELSEAVARLEQTVSEMKSQSPGSRVDAASAGKIAKITADLEESLLAQKVLQMQNEQYQKRLEDISISGQQDSYQRLENQNNILLQELRGLKDMHDKLTEEVTILKKTEVMWANGDGKSMKDKRQSDLFTELIELRAKNDILTKEIVAVKKSGTGALLYLSSPSVDSSSSLSVRSPAPSGSSAATTVSSQSTVNVGEGGWEKEVSSLRREKELYVAEKKVLLELLSSQCDEMDAVEAAKKESDK